MPGAADPQELQVDAAMLADATLVFLTVCMHGVRRHRAARQVHVGRIDVDVVEEMLPHEAVIALKLMRLHWPILVEVERDHVSDRASRLSVQADEFVVDTHRRAAGGQPEHASLAAATGIRSRVLAPSGPLRTPCMRRSEAIVDIPGR